MFFLSFRAAHGCRVIAESGEPVTPEVGEVTDLEAAPAFSPPNGFQDEGMMKTQKGNEWMGQWKQPLDALALLPGSPGKKSCEPPISNPKTPLTDSDSIKGEPEPIAKDKRNPRAHRTWPSRGFRICFTPSRGVYCCVALRALRALEATTPRSKYSRRSGG